MTIGRRIVLGFAIALALTLLLGVIGFYALNRAANGYEGALATETQVRAPAHQALIAIRGANVQYLRYLVEGNASFIAARDSQLIVGDSLLRSLSANSTDPQLREAWTASLGLLEEWRAAGDASIDALIAGDREAGLNLRTQNVQPIRDRLDTAVERGLTLAQTRSDTETSLARGSARAAGYVLTVGTIAVLLIGLVSGYLLYRAIARPLQESANVVASSSTEILAAASEQAAGANETMAAVAQTVATVEEVTLTAQQSSERARAMGSSAERAADLARSGRRAAEDSVATMDAVRQQVEGTAQSILSLAERAQAISEIISTVDDLADQTNLLALNAAVEAARAGDAGRGFAVVAGEVRGLAEESKRATVQVRQILGEIQRATNAAVMTTEQSTARAGTGSKQAAEAGETIRTLAEAVTAASESAAQIVASAGQQAVGMEQIRQAITNIQEATRQNLTASRQTESAAQDLNQLGHRLVELVGGRTNL